jgi:hypothetical protein
MTDVNKRQTDLYIKGINIKAGEVRKMANNAYANYVGLLQTALQSSDLIIQF